MLQASLEYLAISQLYSTKGKSIWLEFAGRESFRTLERSFLSALTIVIAIKNINILSITYVSKITPPVNT